VPFYIFRTSIDVAGVLLQFDAHHRVPVLTQRKEPIPYGAPGPCPPAQPMTMAAFGY